MIFCSNLSGRPNLGLLVVLLLGLFSSCSTEQRKQLENDSKPVAIGNAYQVLMLTDENLLQTTLADSIANHFMGPYMTVPNPEPELDISFTQPRDFRKYAKQMRTIIFLGALDADNPTSSAIKTALGEENIRKAQENNNFRVVTQKNKWARGQQVIYMFAPTLEELPDVIRKYSEKITENIYEADSPIARNSAFAGGYNRELIIEVQEKLGIEMKVPKGYRMGKLRADSTVWLRYEAREVGYNLLISVMQYENERQLTPDGLIDIRNELCKRYITTGVKGAYMTTETDNRPFPVFEQTNVNGSFALEGRGLYKMVNDYMGGAFVTYLIYNANNNKLVFVDGFLQAPSKLKHRDYVERLNAIINTIKI